MSEGNGKPRAQNLSQEAPFRSQQEFHRNDPLLGVPNYQKELFMRLSAQCNGFSALDVIGAAGNLIINAMRQSQTTRQKAEVAFNDVFGQLKQRLVDHYDGTSGRRNGIFAFDQTIQMPHIDLRNKKG